MLRSLLMPVERDFRDKLLIEIGAAIDHGDAKLVNRLSHKIKGSAAVFAANAVVQAAQRLEDMGRANDLNGAVEALANLDRELNRLLEAINAVEINDPVNPNVDPVQITLQTY